MSWLSGYSHRKELRIYGSTTGSQTDYQMMVILYKGSGEDYTNIFYLDNVCRDDFNDIRFTASDGTTLLSHWRQEYESGVKAVFWFKCDIIPANPDYGTYYLYYGKENDVSASNPYTTFIFYDDFNRDPNGLGPLWTPTSETLFIPWVIDNNKASIKTNILSARDLNSSYNGNIFTNHRVRAKRGLMSNTWLGLHVRQNPPERHWYSPTGAGYILNGGAEDIRRLFVGNPSPILVWVSPMVFPGNTEYWECLGIYENRLCIYINDVFIGTWVDTLNRYPSGYCGISGYKESSITAPPGKGTWDDFMVMKFIYPEPYFYVKPISRKHSFIMSKFIKRVTS